jgi:hypothetical protein
LLLLSLQEALCSWHLRKIHWVDTRDMLADALNKGAVSRKALVLKLQELGFECRPIVAGNFAKNEVVKYFDFEVHGELTNSEHIDQNGLFVGNHHFPIPEAFVVLAKLHETVR